MRAITAMSRRVMTALLVCSSGVSWAAAAAELTTGQEALIEQVLERSGFVGQLAMIPSAIETQMAKRAEEFSPERRQQLAGILVEAYRADALHRSVEDTFGQHFNLQKMVEVLAWCNSPLGTRIVQAELDSATPAGQQAIQTYFAAFEMSPPSTERMALAKQLASSGGVAEAMVETTIATFQGMAKVIDPTLPADKRLKPGQLEELAAGMRSELRTQVEEGAIINVLGTYRTLSDEELRQSIGFYESEAGRWFTRLAIEALVNASGQSAERAAAAMKLLILMEQPADDAAP